MIELRHGEKGSLQGGIEISEHFPLTFIGFVSAKKNLFSFHVYNFKRMILVSSGIWKFWGVVIIIHLIQTEHSPTKK